MSYPGNNALSSEVQARILRSFEQTVALARQGNDSEAQLGCEFILGMDPLFRPATLLVERLKAPARPLAVDDLDAQAAMAGPDDGIVTADDLWQDQPMADAPMADGAPMADAPMAEPSDGFFELPDLDSLLDSGPTAAEDLVSARPAPAAPAAAAATPAPVGGLQAVLQDLLERGENERVLQIAENQRAAIEADPQLGAMLSEAQSRIETAQYVQSFLDAARRAQAEGKPQEAERLIAKARILDPENPGLELALAGGPTATAPAASAGGLLDEDSGALPDLLRDEPSDLEGFAPADQAGDLGFLDAPPPAPDSPVPVDPGPVDPGPVAPGPAGLDDATPASAGDDRLETLLAEGQIALDRGEFQSAIDIWSRIFLIDIDNADATERIEEARQRKAEAERQADEVFHDGVAKIESGDLEAARTAFAEVLVLQPGHAMASEYLEQIDSGEVPSPRRARDSSADERISGETALEADGDTPSLEAAVQRDRVVAVKRTDRRLIVIGAAVFLVVAVGGYLLFQQRDRLFPNAGEAPAAQAAVNPQVARATALFDRGNTDAAIRILEAVPAGDPAHAQAQSLLTQYRAAAAPPAEAAAPAPTGPPPQEAALQARLIDGAGTAFDSGENIRARRYLERAASIAPLDGDAAALRDSVDAALAPIADDLDAFERGDWERMLPNLWRRLDEDPDNPDLRMLIVDGYYNLALRSLQRGTPSDAVELIRSALEIEPDNQALGRMLAFAETYQSRPQDLLYRIYVKYLPSRS